MPSARLAIAFLVIFLAVLLVGMVVNSLVSKMVKKTGLSGTDRVVGMLFGFARGVFVVGLLVLSAGLTALPQDPWWTQSRLLPYFTPIAAEVRQYLPAEFAERVDI